VTLPGLLEAATANHPHSLALMYLGRRFTWAQLETEVNLLARGLAEAGVGPGDRVAVLLPNCPQNVFTFWAALRIGAVVVELNTLSPAPELQSQFADCGARIVVTLDRAYERVAQVRDSGMTELTDIVVSSMTEYLPLLDRLLLRLPLPGARRARRGVTARVPQDRGVRSFRSLLDDRGAPARPAGDPQAPAVLQYTTGTTGAPRAAMLTHRNLVANALQCRAWLSQLREGSECVVAVLPLHHVYGLMLSLIYPTAIAAAVLLLPRFDLEELLEVIERYRPRVLPAVPPILRAIVDDPRSRSHDLSCLQVTLCGAMRLPAGVAERFERLTGCPVVEGYGTTETSPVTHVNPVPAAAGGGPPAHVPAADAPPGVPASALLAGERTGSIGLPLPSTGARIVALEDPAVEVPVGQPGELAVRGPQLFAGYWRDDAETSRVLHEGWLLTGDVARMEPDGLFYLVDRKKDLIISGGYNVHPAEVEAVLQQLPWVREVAVVGVPDRHRGETVKAFVVADPAALARAGVETPADAAGVLIEAAEAELAPYKVPRSVEFRADLPTVGLGKIARRLLQAEEIAAARPADRAAAVFGEPDLDMLATGLPGRLGATPPVADEEWDTDDPGSDPGLRTPAGDPGSARWTPPPATLERDTPGTEGER
jgi:long-chain acyl-CoA synthetase